jgi:hypothetical protein
MISPGELSNVVQRLVEDPTILGLGDLDLKCTSSHSGHAGLLLKNRAESILYVVELQSGPTDDRHVIRVVERWAAVRQRHGRSRSFAVLVAEQIAPRYLNILQVIGIAVPVLLLEMRMSEAAGTTTLRFAPVGLRLR